MAAVQPLGRLSAAWRCSWLLCSLLVLASFSVAPVASADPYVPPAEGPTEPAPPEGQPQCPPGELPPFEGEDAAAGEVRLLREELAESCAALAARLDRARERAWWLVAEQLRSQEQAALANTLILEIRDRLKPPLEVKATEAVEVQDPESASAVAAIDAAGAATKEAVWFLIGLAVAVFGSYAIYRQVMPRA